MYYNSDRKLDYIDNYLDNEPEKRVLRWIFEKSEPYEMSEGRDLCFLSQKAMQALFDEISGARAKSGDSMKSFINKYVEWNKAAGNPTSESINKLEDSIDKYRENYVSSPQHLQFLAKECFPRLDAIDCVLASYLWMRYSGMKDSEIEEVRISDVDLVKKVIKSSGRLFQIFDESYELIIATKDQAQFYDARAKKPRNRAEGDKFLRGFSDVNIKYIINTISQRKKNYKQLVPRNVALAGIFWVLYEQEKSGCELDLAETIAREIEGKQYDSNTDYVKIANSMRHSLLNDYRNWKKAYNLLNSEA